MATLLRLAKSGSEWRSNELEAYNISIAFQGAQAFFNETPLPPPSVHLEILTAPTADDAVDEASYNLLTQLDLAMMPTEPEESAVDDFAVALFHSLGYIHRPRAIRTRKELRFFTCGEVKYAKADVCIINRDANDIILLVQEDKRFGGDGEAHPQLIAEAIAAFQDMNSRRRAVGLDPLVSKVCISRLCGAPVFISCLGHPRHNYGWDISEFLQDPSYARIDSMRRVWDVPAYHYCCHWACPRHPPSQSKVQ
jgi:hypothetical protein